MTAAKQIFLLVALATVLALAGCGGDDEGAPIPGATATALQAELDGVQARLDNGSPGACRDILEGSRGPNLERVNELIDALPDNVDPDVRSALEESFDRLWELIQQDCDDKASEEEDAQPGPETTTPTTPEETTPTTPEETTPTTPEEDVLPPEGDGDNGGEIPPGNGNGNGVGNGGGVGPGDQGAGE